ncbi:unnamed protein product [Lactuca saligna]|uniref:Uncharacterized protein n=1 Tax=Lactuca saligna TaxID=75948 RepID=A0AA35YKX3_LACSI|nr:unnamed protein product [Lactuca saligna]
MGVLAGKSTAHIRKIRSLRVVPSNSDEKAESDDAGLRPHKMHKTVSVGKLLGGIDDILGDKFFVTGQNERVAVPSSSVTPPSSFTGSFPDDFGSSSMFGGISGSLKGSYQPERPARVGEVGTTSHSLSFEAYAPGWAITKDSLLSEDITA